MTYNIHRWAGQDQRLDLDRLAKVIEAGRADVVALNEVLHPVDDGARVYEPLAILAQRLNMQYAFGSSGWLDFGPAWHGPVGNALLSRYPLADVANTWLPRVPGSKQRSLLEATLAAGPGQGLGACVTHLDHAFEGTRLVQVEAVLGHIFEHGPHFLAGDFNTPGFLGKHSRRWLPPVLRRLRRAGYHDAFGEVGAGDGKTFPSRAPIFRLDFLFLPLRWARGLRSAQALDLESVGQASDHRPVVAEWAWPEPAGGLAACQSCLSASARKRAARGQPALN